MTLNPNFLAAIPIIYALSTPGLIIMVKNAPSTFKWVFRTIPRKMQKIEKKKLEELSEEVELEDSIDNKLNLTEYMEKAKSHTPKKLYTIEELEQLREKLFLLEDYEINKHTINYYYSAGKLHEKLIEHYYKDKDVNYIEGLIKQDKSKQKTLVRNLNKKDNK